MTGLLIRVGLRTYNEVMTSSLSESGRRDPQNKSGFIGRMVFSHPNRTQDTMLSTATDLHTFDDSASVHVVDIEKGVPSQAERLSLGGSPDIHSTSSEGHMCKTDEILSTHGDFTD
jgi:hypothetical protein